MKLRQHQFLSIVTNIMSLIVVKVGIALLVNHFTLHLYNLLSPFKVYSTSSPSLSSMLIIDDPPDMSTESVLLSCTRNVSTPSTCSSSVVEKDAHAVEPSASPKSKLTFFVASI